MSVKSEVISKTLGFQSALLIVELNERNKTTFNLRDVEEITGLQGSSARTLIHKASKRGLITRLQPGLYTLVPFELGRATEYVGDPYVIAKELCGGKDYFLSHASAMELHRMVTQPQFTIYVSSSLRKPSRNIHGYEYHFVTAKPEQVFGLTQIWVNKQQAVMVSDPERTIIDALRQPQYAGGIPEVAKALWISRSNVSVFRLLEYAHRFETGALTRRLGFLLELYQMALSEQLEPLRSTLSATYDRLDPTLPKSGSFQARWRLQLNIDIDELQAIPHT
ncbi:MAG: type IV toxin-antitoxin system AbiEi family antitoxin domain-containing protein [Anaerolineae bacterium]|nr:type IV toxin-antitoxin system AbiEi family antitoxin domain-containing protein [Gloeobacterales cyanobacterium ES-bin-313]